MKAKRLLFSLFLKSFFVALLLSVAVDSVAQPTGAINSLFSVAEGQYVCFSQGNLQYNAAQGTHATANGGTAQGTWRFAEHQGDIAGTNNHNISETYSGWIDLFGYGTSGWNSGVVCYQPWSVSNTASDYLQESLTGSYANADWGVYNAISNGGNQPGLWRTLTSDEWNYILNGRPTNSGIRYVKATVNGVCGLILLPDAWNENVYPLNRKNAYWVQFDTNVISASDWTNVLEAHGAVFLPVANNRVGSSYQQVLGQGLYRTANPDGVLNFYDVNSYGAVSSWVGVTSSGVARYFGYSVRLVNAPSQGNIYSITLGASPSTGGKVTGMGSYLIGSKCTIHATPNGHYTFVRWLKNGSQVSTNPTYSFTVTESANYVAEFAAPVGGTGQLNGVFSIDENTQVNFSKGNLQYQASTNTWRFAMNQYEHMGAENENVSPSYSGWIDLFGWGTSGYNHGANCYQPWSTSNNNGDYYAYGQPGYNLSDQSGKADWGYNAISNGGNSTNSGWRTLTSQEWDYLFNNRFTASGARYAKATVNGIGGVILLPDDWNASLYSLDDINNSYADYLNNNITDSEWTNVFETAGAVFLPAAARMISGSIVEEDEFAAMYKAFGFYWSSSAYDNDRVKGLYFYGAFNSAAFFLNEAFLSANNFISRNNAASVRLVRPTQNTTYVIGASPSSNEYGTVSGAGLYLSGQVCSLTATANTGYTFTCWTYNGRLVSTNPTYSFVVTENATCKAEFAPNSYGISVSANPSNGGSVSGGGVYLFGSSCTVSAIPNENCSFMYWTVNGVQVSTNAEYTFTVSSDCNLMAHFSLPEVVTYSISASSNLSGGGSIQGTGEYPGNSTCTLMAIANEGYVFESWTEGEFTVSNDAVFSFTVTGNRNLIANYVVSSVGDYVDLGLPSGVLWAACNLGTYKSGSYGDKFAWGETETKDQFNWDSYLYSNGSLMTKYCNNSNYGYNGFTDNLTVLLPMDDAATANWGPAWRMPTIDEWRELLEHTTHTRVYVDGNIGCLFAGTNGNSIFIPIYDYNYPYWSSSLDVEEPDGAMCFSRYQFSETVDYSYFRRDGNYVRPVRSGSQSCVIGGVADPPEGGSVSGSGNYNIGSTVTISASPSAGYHFVRWTKNGKPVSTNPTHSFTVKTNVSYVAEFSSECNISAVSNPSEGGTISGAGTYEYGTTATLTASANEGYSFAGWTKNGSVVSNNAVYTFTITGDGEFVANFNQNSYYISASVNSSGGGTVIGGGSYSYGSTASLIATADICYKFSCWKKNGVVVSLNPIYNYTVTENASFEAFFEKNRFTISVSADPSEGGDVSGAGVFNQNSTCLLKAVPNTGYSFEYWTKNGSVVSTSLSYSFMVTGDADYVAVFSQNNYAVSVAVIPSEGGTVSGAGNYQQGQTCTLTAVANNGFTFANWTEDDVQISTDATYSFPVTANRNLVAHFLSTTSVSITASANPTDGGTVSGMGAFYIGSTCTLIATANPGYSFMYWTQNGNQVSSNATYSFTVAGDCDLVAHFSPPMTITASTNPSMGGGSVAGDGVYNYGTTCTLSATTNPGYSFIKWTKNGEAVSYFSSFSFSVTEDADYVAVFELTAGVVIGESEGANVYLPSYSFYKHTLSQQIYTSEEIGGSTLIMGISFFNTGGQKTRSYDIYLVHTDKLSFSNNKDWITVAESDRVFSGDVTMMTGCWTTIVLDTPFTYNGTSNLAVVIDDNSGNYTGSPHMSCRVFNTQGNQAIRIYSDGTNYDPYNPSGYNGTLYSEKNQIVFRNTLTFDISVTANLTGGGTVAGAGSYENGTTCTLTATANPGYTFIKWTRNREDVSYLSPFSFSVSEGGDYVAVFEETSGVVVGVPEGTNQYVPSYPLNSYALSQQIYTNDEIGESGVITDLSFFNTGEQSTRNYDIYLVHTDKSDFGTVAGFMIILQGKDWIAVTESDRVFSGAVTMATGCWTTITLDTPFAYNGISNLAVVIDDNTGSGSGDMSCRAFHDQDRQAVSVCSDGTNYDPFNPSGYGITSHSLKNQMVFQISPFNITALANPTEGGTVSGSGIYQQGQTCTLTATAYTGYAFTSWTENGVVVSTDATYSFTFSGNRTLVANFSYRNYTITASSNLSAGGTVSGAGDYIYGSTCTLTATANPGYTFIKWTKNGSDFSYRSPYSFSVAEDADFVAVFEETTGVVVGGPQAVNAYLPSCSFREFSLSQQIYTKDEIGGKGVITGLSFFNTWDQFTRNFDIYLVHTDKTAFGSDTDWIAVSESDLVFSGDVDMMTGCWTTIVFDTPFTYNGTSNLAVVVDDNTDIQYLSISNLSCRVFDTQELQAIRIFGNGNNYDPYNPSGYVGTRYSVKNQVVIHYQGLDCPSCSIVFDLYDSFGDGWNGNYLVVSYGDVTEQFTVGSGSFASYSREIATGSVVSLSWVSGSWMQECSFDIKFENGVLFYHGADLSASFQEELTIDCELATAPYLISATVNSSEGGVVEGGGVYEGGTICTLTATPISGYVFMYWMENGEQVSTNATYSFTVTGNRDLVAHFSLPLSITVSSNLSDGGSVTGSGVFNYGTTCTLTAMANAGYSFIKWTKNGETVSYFSPFNFSVTEAADYVAVFEETDGIVVGAPEAANQYLPSYSFYEYALSQQIYMPDEIGVSTFITGLSFFNTGDTKTRNYDIYLVHTDKSAFNSNTDWIAVAESDRVFSGDVIMMSGCWTTIVFDTPFAYDGTSNLAVVIDDNSGNYTYSPHMSCRVFHTENTQAIRVYNIETNYDPFDPSGYRGTLHSEKNQIIFQTSLTQTVQLSAGANWFSTYLDISLEDLQNVLVAAASSPNKSITIKSLGVNSVYSRGRWNTPANFVWDVAKMYYIIVTEDCEITLEGAPINPADHPVTIVGNGVANWIGFPFSTAMSVTDAFAGLPPTNNDIVKKSGANATYTRGKWNGGFDLEPGRGYIYVSAPNSADRVLIFQSGTKKGKKQKK